MKTYNKGEWSEIYAMFKLLGEGKLYSGDANLNKMPELFYPILRVLRTEKNISRQYIINDNIVIVNEDGKELLRKSVNDFLNTANKLFEIIKSSNGTFGAPEIEKFMDEIHCYKVKEKSNEKADIRIVIHDLRTGVSPTLGFSIKSKLGSESTLLNAGKTTNFTYRIDKKLFSEEEICQINKIETRNKIRDRVHKIISSGGDLNFESIDNPIFDCNLTLIDSLLPEIVGCLLKESYILGKTGIKELTEHITKLNPMKYNTCDNSHFYEYKIKQLLIASALGMVPGTSWDGQFQANGGYIIVKEDGDVVCYHFYDRNLFED